MLGRIQIQPDDIAELLREPLVVGEFEGAHQVWLQLMDVPDPPHRRMAHAGLLGHRSRTPMSRVGRGRLDRGVDDLLDLPRAVLGFPPATGFLGQTNQSSLGKALAPPPHHRFARAQLRGDFFIGQPRRSQEDNPCSLRLSHRRPPRASSRRDRRCFLCRENNLRRLPTSLQSTSRAAQLNNVY